MKLHLYSDLNLRYLQHSDPVDEVVPAETDLIVVAGSISSDPKRSLLFQETLKNNNKPVIINLGLGDGILGAYQDTINATQIRYATLTKLNCHYSNTTNLIVNGLDVLNYVGWRHIATEEEYVESNLQRQFVSRVRYGEFQYNAKNQVIGYVGKDNYTLEQYTELVYKPEWARLEKWLATDNELPKLLVTGADARTVLKDQNIAGVTVCTVGSEYLDCEFNGGRLLCNPGSGVEARSRLFDI